METKRSFIFFSLVLVILMSGYFVFNNVTLTISQRESEAAQVRGQLKPPSDLTTMGREALSDLFWVDNSKNEKGFDVERSLDGISFAPIISLGSNVTTYRDSNLPPGKYYYRVKAMNLSGVSDYSNIAEATVLPVQVVPVSFVDVEPEAATIYIGGSLQLSVSLRDREGNSLPDRPVTWSSSNTSVAKVSVYGIVSGVAEGSATITATSEGKSGTAVIVVKSPPLSPPTSTTSGSQ